MYDGQGERVDLGDSGGGEAAQLATVGLSDGLGDGAYIATFRAVSADGHPIRGAFVFQVGAGGQAPDRATVDGLLAAGDDRVWAGVGAGLRFASYAAALVVIGWALLANVLHAGPSSLPRTLAAVCAGASLLQIPAFATEVTGLGAGALLSGAGLIEAATSSVGQAAVLRAGLIAAAVWSPGPLRMVAAVAAASSELVTGHTRTVDPVWLMLPADLVHVVASAVWTGGLVIIFTGWRRHDEAWRASALSRFSNLALVSARAAQSPWLASEAVCWLLGECSLPGGAARGSDPTAPGNPRYRRDPKTQSFAGPVVVCARLPHDVCCRESGADRDVEQGGSLASHSRRVG